jgi:two-component system sensor histidine kinase UhpB
MSAILQHIVDKLEEQYTTALRAFLLVGGEVGLQQAYELGRQALAQGLGVLEMAGIYHKALSAVLSQAPSSEEHARMFETGQSFFMESLSAFEMAHRGFKEANIVLRGLNQKLEDEAKRIAHALHDEAGQLLASVYIALEEVSVNLSVEDRASLQTVKGLLDQIEAQLRRISHELRPTILDDLGLVPALEFLAEGVSSRSKMTIVVDSSIQDRLPAMVETILYRVVQEALNNVTKHAKATCASIHVQREAGMLQCSIHDNGVGFDPTDVMNGVRQKGLGLIGMRERMEAISGTIAITSQPGQGTILSLTIPMES